VPREPFKSRDDLQDLSWRTRELGPDLRRKLFENLVPQNGPRAKPGDRPDSERSEPKPSGSKPADVNGRRPRKKK
jgi:hypothetical protein